MICGNFVVSISKRNMIGINKLEFFFKKNVMKEIKVFNIFVGKANYII